MAQTYTVQGAEVRKRHPLAPAVLWIITLGIYGLVWWFKINKEVRDVTGEGNPWVSLLAMTLGAFLIVPPLVSAFNTASRIRTSQDRAEVSSPVSPVMSLVMMIVPLVNIFHPAYLQGGLNRAWERLLPSQAQASAVAPPAPESEAPAPAHEDLPAEAAQVSGPQLGQE